MGGKKCHLCPPIEPLSVQYRCRKSNKKEVNCWFLATYLFKGVQDESRTHTPNRALPPQSSASTNSATWTIVVERKTGLGPATPTLARSCSTNWATFASKVYFKELERKTGLGPATPTLARSCSTNWATFAIFNHLIFDCGYKGIAFFWTGKIFWCFFWSFFVFVAFSVTIGPENEVFYALKQL